ncbi:hypothetical protein Tco_0645914 [Tanacetum coccineum]
MEARLAPTQPNQVNKITTSCEICSGPHVTQYCMEDPEQAFVEYASLRTDEARDARLSKFEADFKQQQSEMTKKINIVLKAITDRLTGSLPSDMVKNPKLSTSPVLSARSYPTIEIPNAHHTPPLHQPIKNILEPDKNGSAFIQGEVSAKMEDPRLFTLPCRLGDSKPFDTLADRISDRTKSYPVGIVKDVEVHIGKLKLLNDFYIAILLGEWEIARDVEINPFKEVIVFRRMVKFLGAIPINLKSNMWESEDLINNPIKWNKPPKNEDGAWHAKIRLIDPDGEDFTKTLQSTPTTRKLSERESNKGDPRPGPLSIDTLTLYLMRRSLEVLRKFSLDNS